MSIKMSIKIVVNRAENNIKGPADADKSEGTQRGPVPPKTSPNHPWNIPKKSSRLTLAVAPRGTRSKNGPCKSLQKSPPFLDRAPRGSTARGTVGQPRHVLKAALYL